MFRYITALAGLAIAATAVSASHTINVQNNCGYGTPTINGPSFSGPTDISGGYTSSGDLDSFIVFLQNNGQCSANGDNCLILEGTLNASGYSSVDISMIPDHTFNSPLAFSYTDGSGGRSCTSASCSCNYDVFCSSTDYGALVGSPSTTSSITITFC